jgi:putative acetyltransferase
LDLKVIVKPIKPFEASDLIEALDTYQKSLYPPESNHLDSIADLSAANVLMIGAFDGMAVIAMGAVKMFNGYGEIKRLYVMPDYRARGVAMLIMRHLEAYLVELGIHTARLETGFRQEEAIAFYRSIGYRRRGPFGNYKPDPSSIFMEKDLTNANEVYQERP